MQKIGGRFLFSASDLVNFLECDHLTNLDLVNLETPLKKAEDDEQAVLIQKKGFEHEAKYLSALKASGLSVVDVKKQGQNIEDAVELKPPMFSASTVMLLCTPSSKISFTSISPSKVSEPGSALG